MQRFTGLFLLTALMLGMGLALVEPSNGRAMPTPTQTPTQSVPRSLFAEDICTPPCWFGITPGETQSKNVLIIFQQFEELFYTPVHSQGSILEPGTNEIINGRYGFSWRPEAWDRIDTAHSYSTIRIREGVVTQIHIAINHPVNLAQVLSTMGSPEQTIVRGIGDPTIILGIYYPDIQVDLALRAKQDDCLIANIQEDFMSSQ